MHLEEQMARYLDANFRTPVPYVGKPQQPEAVVSARQLERLQNAERRTKAEARQQYLAQWQFEQRRKAAISASQPAAATIIAAVACAHGIVVSHLLSKTKSAKIARARQHAIWELKHRKPTMSSVKVAALLRRDSSTVRDGLKVFEANRHAHEDKIQHVARLLLAASAGKGPDACSLSHAASAAHRR